MNENLTCGLKYNYAVQMDEYVSLAYKTLKAGRHKIPTQGRMEKPLKIMFVIHNRDNFGYTTIEEFAETLKNVVGISEDTVYQRVVGSRIPVLYEGIRMLLNKYVRTVGNFSNRLIGDVWYYYDKSQRYIMLIKSEEKLYAEMLLKLGHSGRL